MGSGGWATIHLFECAVLYCSGLYRINQYLASDQRARNNRSTASLIETIHACKDDWHNQCIRLAGGSSTHNGTVEFTE